MIISAVIMKNQRIKRSVFNLRRKNVKKGESSMTRLMLIINPAAGRGGFRNGLGDALKDRKSVV